MCVWAFSTGSCLQSSHLFESGLCVIANASCPALFIFIQMPWVAFLSVFSCAFLDCPPWGIDTYTRCISYPALFTFIHLPWVAVLWFEDSHSMHWRAHLYWKRLGFLLKMRGLHWHQSTLKPTQAFKRLHFGALSRFEKVPTTSVWVSNGKWGGFPASSTSQPGWPDSSHKSHHLHTPACRPIFLHDEYDSGADQNMKNAFCDGKTRMFSNVRCFTALAWLEQVGFFIRGFAALHLPHGHR